LRLGAGRGLAAPKKLQNVMAVTDAIAGSGTVMAVRMTSRAARGSTLQKGNLRPHSLVSLRLPPRACREIAMLRSNSRSRNGRRTACGWRRRRQPSCDRDARAPTASPVETSQNIHACSGKHSSQKAGNWPAAAEAAKAGAVDFFDLVKEPRLLRGSFYLPTFNSLVSKSHACRCAGVPAQGKPS
jgi:hypothetical protein